MNTESVSCPTQILVMVELLFLPSVYTPCPACQGRRLKPESRAVKIRQVDLVELSRLTIECGGRQVAGIVPTYGAARAYGSRAHGPGADPPS